MESGLSIHKTLSFPHFLRSSVKSKGPGKFTPAPFSPQGFTFTGRRRRNGTAVVASAGASSHCDFSSLNAPLEPQSLPGIFLSSVLQNQRQLFHFAADDELKRLAEERDAAVERMKLSSGSDEACLHRRIAELKECDCQFAVEDIMYMLVFYKFSEIKVPLVPRLSSCVYNGRLEIWPSKDWALESIHSFETLQMVREHVSTVIGLRANSSVTESWATTEIPRLKLARVYVASIFYGYFLRSASVRYDFESLFAPSPGLGDHLGCRTSQFTEAIPEYRNLIFGHSQNMQSASCQQKKRENFRSYVMGFDPTALQLCARLRSKEAVSLAEKQSCALFGDESNGMLESDEMILTSFSSLKRLVLEAVAFGTFLWDVEEHVDRLYKLKEY